LLQCFFEAARRATGEREALARASGHQLPEKGIYGGKDLLQAAHDIPQPSLFIVNEMRLFGSLI